MKRMILFAMVLLLAGCSGGTNEAAQAYPATGMAESNAMYDDGETPEFASSDDGFSYRDNDEEEIDPAKTSEKLVYRADIDLETLEYVASVKSIRELVAKHGGMIESERESDYDTSWYTGSSQKGTRYLSMIIRVPSGKFYVFLDDMEGSGKITSRSTSIENITKQYSDNSMRIKALEVQEENLLKMMEQAETINDMIAVESRLSEVQYELNRLKSYQSNMDTDVAYSTIELSVKEVKRYTEEPEETFFHKVADRFTEGWERFVDFVEGLILLVIDLWPFVLVIAALAWVKMHFFKDKKLFHFRKKAKNGNESEKTSA